MSDSMIKCCECTKPVARQHYQEVTGWVKVRDAGGANTVTKRRETGRVMCVACMLVAKGPQSERLL